MTDAHTIFRGWGSVSFWKQRVACNDSDAWTDANVSVANDRAEWSFSDHDKLEHFMHCLDLAFELGKFQRSREFAALINKTSFGV